VNGSGINHTFTTLGTPLIVLAQAPVPTKPGKRTFNDPAAGQNNKALLVRWAFHNVKRKLKCFMYPVNEATLFIDTVSPNAL